MQTGSLTDLVSSSGTSAAEQEKRNETSAGAEAPEQRGLFLRAQRRKLPNERRSITHKFSVGGHEGYITVGMYEDGRPGEVFIKMSKEGSTLSGVMDGLALTLSIGLQYGFASSLLDYVGRWLGGKFISTAYLKLGAASGATGPEASPAAPTPAHLA